MLVKKHCQITNSLSCYNVYNNGQYIQELIPNKELQGFLDLVGGKLTEKHIEAVKLPISEHENFYRL